MQKSVKKALNEIQLGFEELSFGYANATQKYEDLESTNAIQFSRDCGWSHFFNHVSNAVMELKEYRHIVHLPQPEEAEKKFPDKFLYDIKNDIQNIQHPTLVSITTAKRLKKVILKIQAFIDIPSV